MKAMECASLIGTSLAGHSCQKYSLPSSASIAVGRDIFRPDADTRIELLMRMQSACPPHFVSIGIYI